MSWPTEAIMRQRLCEAIEQGDRATAIAYAGALADLSRLRREGR